MAKTVLVTGTSNGFGNDVVTSLSAAGHRVFATMRDVSGRNRDAADALRSRGIETLELDVTNTASVDAAFRIVAEKTGGKLDVVLNNAGVAAGGVSEAFTPEQLQEMFDVNVFGLQRVLRAALPIMRKNQSGLVINVGSILGRLTIPFFGLYGASKHAVEAMTDTYRYEVSQLGVDVVLLQPGPFPTKLYSAMHQTSEDGRSETYGELAAIPGAIGDFLGKLFASANAPNPHDVATAVLTLLDTPAGKRPPRVVVGGAFGADRANTAIAPLQAGLVEGFGLQYLGSLKTS